MVFDPVTFGVNFAIGGVQSLLSSNQRNKSNKQARDAAKRQNKYNKEMWRFNNREGQRRYEFAQEGIEIARENQSRNIELQQLIADEGRDYNMAIQKFNYDNQVAIRDEQIRVAQEQAGFNADAYATALLQQQNFMYEQNLALDLEGIDAMTNFQFDQRELDQKQMASRSKDNFEMQAEQIAGLKAEGAARAKGQSGRTAGKVIQAAIAENGFKQAQIAESTMQAMDQYALSTEQNIKKLQDMSRDIILTRASLQRQDKFTRQDLQNQFEQANAEAFNNIMLNPVLAPDLPEVPNFADYAEEIQDALPYEAPPEPEKVQAAQQQGSFFNDFLNSSGGQAAIEMGISGLSDAFVSKPPTAGGNSMNMNFNGGNFNPNNFRSGLGFNYN